MIFLENCKQYNRYLLGEISMRICTLFSFTAILLSSCLCFAADTEKEYYALLVDNKKVGSVKSERTVDSGRVRTTETTRMSLGRAGVTINITVIDKSVETVDGKPISFKSIQDMGAMKVITSGRFLADGKVEITKNQMGSVSKNVIEVDPSASMVEGMRLLQEKKGLKEGTKYSAKLFVPSMLKAVDAEVHIGGTEKVDLFGRVVSLTKTSLKMETPGGKIETTAYVDSEQNALKSVTPMMGMELVMVACDKQFALSADDEVDFLNKMMVKSPKPLKTKGEKVLGKITYTIAPKQGKEINIPSNDNQKVKKLKGGKLLVTIDPAPAPDNFSFPYTGDDKSLLECIEPTEYLQSDNKKIVALAEKAVGKTKDAGRAVKKIEKFVDQYITAKNLSVGYATALEVAKSKTGDCSEHAVLTAAMCRALGIPSKVACGLVYADGFTGRKDIFAGHAWVEVYIGGKWIGLDATRPYGAGHITLASGNGDPDAFFSMANTFGYIDIEKVEQF